MHGSSDFQFSSEPFLNYNQNQTPRKNQELIRPKLLRDLQRYFVVSDQFCKGKQVASFQSHRGYRFQKRFQHTTFFYQMLKTRSLAHKIEEEQIHFRKDTSTQRALLEFCKKSQGKSFQQCICAFGRFKSPFATITSLFQLGLRHNTSFLLVHRKDVIYISHDSSTCRWDQADEVCCILVDHSH